MPPDRSSQTLRVRRFPRQAGRFVALASLSFLPLPAALAQVQAQYGNEPSPYGAPGQVQAIPISPQAPYPGAMPSLQDPAQGYPQAPPSAEYGSPAPPIESVPLPGYAGPGSTLGQPQALPPNLPPTPGATVAPSEPQLSDEDLVESAEVVARVGRETILAGDLLGMVNQQIEAAEARVPPEQIPLFRKEAAKHRRMLMQRLTQMAVEMKLLYFDFARAVPPERQVELKNKVGAAYMESEAPKMMETFKVSSIEELDAKLRTYGSSVRKAQQMYVERSLGMILLKSKIDDDPDVSLNELLARYEEKKDKEYFRPSRVKYEELVVKFSKFPDKTAAFAELADMGNEVLRGAPFSAVAKRRSHGIGAATSGGQQDWTNRGSLVTKQVEDVLFEIPLGKLSRIIEEGDAFYIVRAIEREDERFVSFEEVQEDLREEIRREKIAKEQEDYLLSLYEKTHVWNAFEDEAVPSIAQREREFYENGTPLFLVGKRDGDDASSGPSSSAKPDAGQERPTPQVPGGGSYQPAPSEFEPSSPSPGSQPSGGGEYQLR